MDEEKKRNPYKLDELECLNDLACLVVTLRETLFRIALKNNTEQAMLLALQADKKASFGTIVKVLDALKLAGVKNLPAFTRGE